MPSLTMCHVCKAAAACGGKYRQKHLQLKEKRFVGITKRGASLYSNAIKHEKNCVFEREKMKWDEVKNRSTQI